MIGFVDDTSGSTNDFLQAILQPLEHYAQLASTDAKLWNDTLALSGGALEDTKCSYHFMTYEFSPQGLPILKAGTFAPSLSIKPQPDSPPNYPPSTVQHKTLETYKSPNSSSTTAFSKLHEKSESHSKTIAQSPFDRTDSWSYYHAIYLPSICYPLPSCAISHHDCLTLQRQIKQALLPKYGLNRNTPNAIVYGHTEYAGIGLLNLHTEQGIFQIESLVKCLRSHGLPQKLAEILISWAQLITGTRVSLLDDVSTPLPHLEPMKWLPVIRFHLHKMGSRLILTKTFVPPLQRVNACFLMDVILNSAIFTPHQLKIFNACRLYLGVTLLSDITTSSGTHIYHSLHRGRPTARELYIHSPTGTFNKYKSHSNIIQQHTSMAVPQPSCFSMPVNIDNSTTDWCYQAFSLTQPLPPVTAPTSFSAFISQLEPWESLQYILHRQPVHADDPMASGSYQQSLSTPHHL